MGWGGPGINRLDSGTSGRNLSPTPLPIPASQRWKGAPGGKGYAGPSGRASPSHQSNLPAGQRDQPSPHSILIATRAQNLSPLPPKPLKVAGGGGEKESTEQVQRKQMLVPEFYLRGWGERRAGSGGVFGDPRALCGVSWVGQETQKLGLGPKGCWVALRDLGSKLGSPSTLGSLASNCKANLFGAGTGGRSPVGGE